MSYYSHYKTINRYVGPTYPYLVKNENCILKYKELFKVFSLFLNTNYYCPLHILFFRKLYKIF